MGYIKNGKNLKLALISNEGRVTTYYNEDYKGVHHYDIIYDAVMNDYKNNKKLVAKVNKKRGQASELIKIMKNSDFIVVYDSTNYDNYRDGDAHSATIVLPKELSKISSKQIKSFLKISRDVFLQYNMSDGERELTEVAYSDKKNKVVTLGTLSDVVEIITRSNDNINEESKNNRRK